MTQLFEINVELSPNQKDNLGKAHKNKESITLRLTSNALTGNNKLMVPATVLKRYQKSKQMKKRYGYKTVSIKYHKPNWRQPLNISS